MNDWITKIDSNIFFNITNGIVFKTDNILADMNRKELSFHMEEMVNNDVLTITVEITNLCNFRCSYCYQNFYQDKRVINKTVIHNIIIYIQSVIARTTTKLLNLRIIGGEPLLFPDHVIYLCHELTKTVDIPIYIHIDTNGSTNLSILEDVQNVGTINICLSYKEDHNKLRYENKSVSSYDIIISNIKKLNVNENTDLVIRYNVHKNNIYDFESFIIDIFQKLKNKKYRIDVAKIKCFDKTKFNLCLDDETYLKYYINIILPILYKYDHHDTAITYPKPLICQAHQPFSIKIFADGKIGLCDASMHSNKLFDLECFINNPELIQKKFKYKDGYIPTSNTTCCSCKYHNICVGKVYCNEIKCNNFSSRVYEAKLLFNIKKILGEN
ncbi:MAG: radical SAM protein [Candidatus Fimenecus sp.]